MKKVIVYPSDSGGCGSYRMIWPSEALAKHGYNVKVSKKRPYIILDRVGRVSSVMPIDADAIVLQRPCTVQIVEAIELFKKQGLKIVIDMDDDLTCIHPMNPAYKAYNRERQHWKFGTIACEMADLVTVTTDALAERYGFGHVKVLPNCIPERFLDIEGKRDERCTVGWAGYTATHPEDLQVTHGAINEALSKQYARFLAIGDHKALSNLGVKNRFPHSWQEGVSIQEYPDAVAQLDIGIVPLANSEFNQAKSWLKALEYAALGVASVVSPTPDNMRIVNAGAAFVAESPRMWNLAVKGLIVDPLERSELAERAREFARKWTIENNAHEWWESWLSILT